MACNYMLIDHRYKQRMIKSMDPSHYITSLRSTEVYGTRAIDINCACPNI